MLRNYDVGDSPDNATRSDDNRHQFSAIAKKAWDKINGWQKKAENAAGWFESLQTSLPLLASGKKHEDMNFVADTSETKMNQKLNADGNMKGLTLPSGFYFSERAGVSLGSTPSVRSMSSSASTSLSGTPVLSSKSISSLSLTSSPEISHLSTTSRRSISPFPANDVPFDDGEAQYLVGPCESLEFISSQSFQNSLSSTRDSPKDFAKVSKALRQGWRWLVCRYLMREAGSASVDRLLKYCGFDGPSEATYTLKTFADDGSRSCATTERNDLCTNRSVSELTAQSDLLTPTIVPEGERSSSCGTCSEDGRVDNLHVNVCGDMLRRARLQREEIRDIVKDAQSKAAWAGMWPPLSWGGISVQQGLPSRQSKEIGARAATSASSIPIVRGPSDFSTRNPADSSRFSWDKVTDLLGPMMQKSNYNESATRSSGFALWQGTHDNSTICVGEVANDSPVRDQSIYVVSSVEGHSYEGEFREGKMHGYGRLKWPDGHWYQGEFDKERTCGIGMRGWPSGHWYVGEEQGGWKEGLGAMGWPGGRRYEGEFSRDLRNGFGLMTWPAGRWYLGFWKDGLQHGEGLEGGEGVICLVQSVAGARQKVVSLQDSSAVEADVTDLIAQNSSLGIPGHAQSVNDDVLRATFALRQADEAAAGSAEGDDVGKRQGGRGRRRGSRGEDGRQRQVLGETETIRVLEPECSGASATLLETSFACRFHALM